MNFASPAYLALLSLAIPILLFHMLRTRRRKVMISSTLLWKLAPKELASARAIRRFVPSILLVFQLLALSALVMAVAKPVTRMIASTFGRTVVVVDASASMSAVDGGRSGFQKAAALLSEVKGGRQSFTIVKAGWEPEVVARDISKSAAAETVADLRACMGGSSLDEAVETAKEFLAADKHNNDKIIVFSDAKDISFPGTECIRVPIAHGNQAISSFDIRALNERPGSYRWTAAVRNLSNRASRLRAYLSIDGTEVFSTAVSLRPGQTAVLPQAGSGNILDSKQIRTDRRITFAITPQGDTTENCLSADDKAYLVLKPFSEMRITLIRTNTASKESSLIELLSEIPWVRLSVRGAGSSVDSASSLTIYDGVSPATPPKGKSLVISALPGYMTVESRADHITQEFTDWDKTAPLLRFMDLTGVTADRVISHEALPGASVLAEGQDSPLIETISGSDSEMVVLAFDPEKSTIINRTAFPIFVANLLDWAQQPLRPEDRRYMNTGDVVDLRKYTGWRLSAPSGAEYKPDSMSLLEETGFYTITYGEVQRPLAVNFGSKAESDILNQTNGMSSASGTSEQKVRRQLSEPTAPEPLWRPLSIAALVLLTAEWLLYTGTQLGRIRRSKV